MLRLKKNSTMAKDAPFRTKGISDEEVRDFASLRLTAEFEYGRGHQFDVVCNSFQSSHEECS
jgi:hypothetical protein